MNNFFHELKRRNVLKSSISYVIISWLILQVGSIVFPILGFGTQAMRGILIFLIIGFPIWIAFAYFFELTPEGFKKTSEVAAGESIHKSTSKKLNAYIIGGLSLAVVLLVVDRVFNITYTSPESAIEKSIAVLPFTNLSNDPDQEYFSDGLTDDILTQLAKIKEFKIISRTSVMQYKNDPPPIKVIAEELGVGMILEGSVQKSGNKLRITAQLINAETDDHLWADSYDKSIDDLFAIQRDVAVSIAEILKAQLSPEETERLNETPTENIAAYQLYQQGVYYMTSSHYNQPDWERAIDLFEEAIALDSNFAEAYGKLAHAHARIYHLARDHSEEREKKATEAAKKAIELAPNNPNVKLSNGYVHLWVHNNKDTALEYFEEASELLPNNLEILKAMASIYESENKQLKYAELYERAVSISPRDEGSAVSLCFGYFFSYQFEKGIQAINRAMVVAPKNSWNNLTRGFLNIMEYGANADSRKAFELVDKNHSWYVWVLFLQNMGEENGDQIMNLAEEFPDGVDTKLVKIPSASLKGFVYQKQRKSKEAKVEFQKAINELLAELENHPEDDRYHSALGLAYAGFGNAEKAIYHGIKATELLPMSKDASYGQAPLTDLALIYTMLGENDKAFENLEIVLSDFGYWTVNFLKDDFRFDPLRSDPRFEAITKKYDITKNR